MQLGFLVNMEKCIGCESCAMACKNLYQTDAVAQWRRLYQMDEAKFPVPIWAFMSISCNHCARPECKRVCPVGAYTKRPDGIVLHNHSLCIGCRSCVMACPYGAPQYNPHYGKVEKCQLCFQRIDEEKKPECVDACPQGALQLVRIDSDSADVVNAVTRLPGFPDPAITGPSVRFVPPSTGLQVRRD